MMTHTTHYTPHDRQRLSTTECPNYRAMSNWLCVHDITTKNVHVKLNSRFELVLYSSSLCVFLLQLFAVVYFWCLSHNRHKLNKR